jgi:hypothetical protein
METLHDDNFSEGAFQVELEGFLRALVLRVPRYKLYCERFLKDGNKEYRPDMIIVDTVEDIAVILELARVRHKYILSLKRGANISQTKPWNIEILNAEIDAFKEEDLLQLQCQMYEKVIKVVKTDFIAALLKEKREQGQKYANILREKPFIPNVKHQNICVRSNTSWRKNNCS